MDIDALVSKFGGDGSTPVVVPDNAIDVHGLAAKFGGEDKAKEVEKLPEDIRKVFIYPKGPIAQDTPQPVTYGNAPTAEEIAASRLQTNPRDDNLANGISNYIPAIATKIKDNAIEGGKNFSSGLGDIVNQGDLAGGAKKMAVGGLQALTSIPSGMVSEGIEKPIANLTGSPEIADRAGFVAGSAIPVVPGLGAVSKLRPSNVALKDLTEIITNNGANPENLIPVVKGMKANPRLGPADLNPAVLSTTQKLFTTEGDAAKNYLASTSTNRMSTAKDTVNSAFDTALGKTVNTADKLQELKDNARRIGKTEIEPFLAANPHADVTGLIKHIDSEIGYPAMKAIKEGRSPPIPLTPYQSEILDIRSKLRNPSWPDRDQMFAYSDQLHNAQSQLRETAQGLAKSTAGSEQNTAKKLFSFREKMKDVLGPEYKEKLGKYADEKSIDSAFRYGHDEVLKSGKSLEHDPSFFEKWVNDPKRKPAELEAAREGARRSINAEINGTRTAATNPASRAVGIGQNDFSRERVTALLGKEEADKLFTALDHARLEANTHTKLIEGSQTANRLAADSRVALPVRDNKSLLERSVLPLAGAAAEAGNAYLGGQFGLGAVGLAASLAASKGAGFIKDKVALSLAKEKNAQLAKLALPVNGPERDALIQHLENAIPGPKQSIMRRAAKLSSMVGP